MSQETVKKFDEYGQSEKGNFRIIDDSLVFPHPFMIRTKHVEISSDNHMGMLGDAFKQGYGCYYPIQEELGTTKCNRPYNEHEKSLTVGCKTTMVAPTSKVVKELQQYLLKIKPLAAKNGFGGFAFVDKNGKGTKTT